MASATETLQLILSAKNQGSAEIQNFGRSVGELRVKAEQAAVGAGGLGAAHEKLGGSTRALNAGLVQVVSAIGLEGPAANVAGSALLHLNQGFTMTTGAALGAGVGLTLFVSALKAAAEEREAFTKAAAAGDIGFFREEVRALNESIGDRKPFDLAIGNWGDLYKSAKAVLFNLDEKLAGYKIMLESLTSARVRSITDEFERQKTAVDAMGIEKLVLDYDKAKGALMNRAREQKISREEFGASLKGLQAVRDASIANAERESLAANRTPEVNAINEVIRAELRLREAQRAGDSARAVALQKDVDAARTKIVLMDQEIVKKRALELVTITQGLAEKGLLDSINTEMERQNALFKAGSISGRELNDNLKGLGELKTTFADIRTAADDFLKRGVKAGTADVAQMEKSIVDLENRARETYGVAIPASVSAAIAKLKEFIKTLAEASGIDQKKAQESVAGALGGALQAAGLSKTQGSLEGIKFLEQGIMGDFQGLVDLSGGWKENVLGTKGAFTNLIGPIENIRNATQGTARDFEEAQQGADDVRVSLKSAPAIFAAAAQNAAVLQGTIADNKDTAVGLAATLLGIEQTIARINAQGGLQVVQ